MTEVWQQIPGAPGYDASTLGNIRSWLNTRGNRAVQPRLLRPQPDRKGYLWVRLKIDGAYRAKFVHVLVLITYVGPQPDGTESRHFPDGSPSNNRRDNLSWGTKQQNAADKTVHGTVPHGESHWTKSAPDRVARGQRHGAHTKPERRVRGEAQGASKLCDGAVHLMRWLSRCHDASIRTLADWFDVSINAAHQAVTGASWSHVTMIK